MMAQAMLSTAVPLLAEVSSTLLQSLVDELFLRQAVIAAHKVGSARRHSPRCEPESL